MITNLSIDFIHQKSLQMEAPTTSLSLILLPEIRTCTIVQQLQNEGQESIGNFIFDQSHSLQILGSNLCIPEKTSAFSIYSGQYQSEQALSIQIEEQKQSQLNYQCSQSQEKMKKKKVVKDKKELMRLQTKNLNRFFRSKINEMLRDIKEKNECPTDTEKTSQLLAVLNKSNKIMFSQMRQIIQDSWLNGKLMKCQAALMKYVHRGKMGMSSKLVMLKYFDKILKAIKNPEKFTCWK